jgi:hypothetical protein
MQLQRGLNGFVGAIVNLGLVTPGQKLRVGLHVVNQHKHFPCRVWNDRASIYLSHIVRRLIQDTGPPTRIALTTGFFTGR